MLPFDRWRDLTKQAAGNDVAPSLTARHYLREHVGRAYYLALRMLGDDADAEAVTLDVLLQVVRKLDTFGGEAELTTWLHRTTVNAVLLHRRAKLRRLRPKWATE